MKFTTDIREIRIEHIDSIYSWDSKLSFMSILSVRILLYFWDKNDLFEAKEKRSLKKTRKRSDDMDALPPPSKRATTTDDDTDTDGFDSNRFISPQGMDYIS